MQTKTRGTTQTAIRRCCSPDQPPPEPQDVIPIYPFEAAFLSELQSKGQKQRKTKSEATSVQPYERLEPAEED